MGIVSDAEFHLDTSNFDAAAEACKKLSKQMSSLKDEMDTSKNKLMFSWAGEGRDMFEKKYRVLAQQLGDLGDSLMDIAEEIYEKEQTYIQTDTDSAKTLDGVTNRY